MYIVSETAVAVAGGCELIPVGIVVVAVETLGVKFAFETAVVVVVVVVVANVVVGT